MCNIAINYPIVIFIPENPFKGRGMYLFLCEHVRGFNKLRLEVSALSAEPSS